MAFVFSKNQYTTTGPWWYLKQAYVAAGGVVKSSGDGLSAFSSSGDILSSPAAGANGMGNSGAWYRMRAPGPVLGVTREFMVQVNGGTGSVGAGGFLYSYSAGFTGGSPSATVAPTASDQQDLTANVFMNVSLPTGYHLNVGVDNAAPYGFWCTAHVPGGTSGTDDGPTIAILWDYMIAGSGPKNDLDPYLWYIDNGSGGCLNINKLCTASFGGAFFNKGTTSEQFGVVTASVHGPNSSKQLAPKGLGGNIYTLDQEHPPLLWARSPASLVLPGGIKGIGYIMRWTAVAKRSGDLLTSSTTGDRVNFGLVNFPWDGTAVAV